MQQPHSQDKYEAINFIMMNSTKVGRETGWKLAVTSVLVSSSWSKKDVNCTLKMRLKNIYVNGVLFVNLWFSCVFPSNFNLRIVKNSTKIFKNYLFLLECYSCKVLQEWYWWEFCQQNGEKILTVKKIQHNNLLISGIFATFQGLGISFNR